MDDLDITRLRVYVVAPDVTPPYRFTGACETGKLYYNIVKLTTRYSVYGSTGVLSSDYYEPNDWFPSNTTKTLAETRSALRRMVA